MARYYDDDFLMHRAHKYIKRERKNGKWRYYYNPNKYEINPSNYAEKTEALKNEQEWKDIVNRQDPEYTYVDENGNTQFNFDKYLLNKKHPILDALSDFDAGRKRSILKQDSETIHAGLADYVTMGKNTIKNLLMLSVGVISAKVLNNQGSLEGQKQEIRDTYNSGKKMTKDIINNYDNATNSNTVTTKDLMNVTGVSDKDIDAAKKAIDDYKRKYY